MQGGSKIGDTGIFSNVPTDYQVLSVADFNNDGKADIFWRRSNGENVLWNMNNGSQLQNGNDSIEFVGPEFAIAGTADFNGDGKMDILWRNTSGSNVIWNMNYNSTIKANTQVGTTGNNLTQVKGIFAK